MQDADSEDHVITVGFAALQFRINIEVEEAVIHEVIFGKGLLSRGEEETGDIGEVIGDVLSREGGENMACY